jgi:uncharacterized membrane protein/rubredoxin
VKSSVKCKVCGYVMAEGKLGDRCPACGAPRAAFEPFTDRISERRRSLLDLHLHPMFIHFPQAFSVSVLVLSFAPFIFRGQALDLLWGTLKILALALPLAAAAAFAAGVVDGRTRFKSIRRSPILRRKLIFGSLLILSSLGATLQLWRGGVSESRNLPVIVLALIAFLSSFSLGLLGNKITGSEMPGS